MSKEQVVHSKMEELQKWLEQKIQIIQNDISLLDEAINLHNSYKELYLTGNKVIMPNMRYSNLTSDEIEAKVSEDCGKLEELKKQIELLQSARALNIYEVIKKWFVSENTWDVEINKAFPDPYILFVSAEGFKPRVCVKVCLGSRKLKIIYSTRGESDDFGHNYNYDDQVDEYNFCGVTDIICGRHNLEIKLQSGHTAFLSSLGKPIIRVR